MSPDDKKKAAAGAALELVPRGAVIGVGTGSTTNHFIDALAAERGRIEAAVASSQATRERLERHGIRVIDLVEVESLGLYVDGADEATRDGQLIKGGGEALTREKIVAAASEEFVCIIDDSKLVKRLGRSPVPVETIPMALRLVSRRIERLGGRPVTRAGFKTDNGNCILDVHDLRIDAPLVLESELNQLAGVVSNGLFCRRPADLLIVAGDEGVETFGGSAAIEE